MLCTINVVYLYGRGWIYGYILESFIHAFGARSYRVNEVQFVTLVLCLISLSWSGLSWSLCVYLFHFCLQQAYMYILL